MAAGAENSEAMVESDVDRRRLDAALVKGVEADAALGDGGADLPVGKDHRLGVWPPARTSGGGDARPGREAPRSEG